MTLIVEPVLCCCTVVTSQPDTVDMTVTFLSSHRRLELKSDTRENNSHPFCTAHFAPVLRRFPLLHGSGAGIPGIGILIYSWYCGIGILSADGVYHRGQKKAKLTEYERRARRFHWTDYLHVDVQRHFLRIKRQ